ncbi:hypothetical protein D3C72_2461770 [compost metagenome]
MAQQDRLDFARADLLAAKDDELLVAPDQVQRALGIQEAPIAGDVPAGADLHGGLG